MNWTELISPLANIAVAGYALWLTRRNRALRRDAKQWQEMYADCSKTAYERSKTRDEHPTASTPPKYVTVFNAQTDKIMAIYPIALRSDAEELVSGFRARGFDVRIKETFE